MSVDIERFGTVPLFEGLKHTEVADLLRIAEDVAAKEGDEIVRQGDAGDGFYIIGAGKFEVLKSGKNSEVLARLEDLSYFGEMSLIAEDERSASVICVEAGRLKKIPKDKFKTQLESGDITAYKVVLNMCRILARRLARADERRVS